MSVFISVPIYDAFSRASQIQQARAGEDDLRQAIRARELSVRAQVSAAFRGLVASYEKIGLQQRGKTASLEALDLATQRYRVGSGTYLELLDARYAADQADANYVNAVYDYHKAIAQLEVAVGRRLH
jgi:outer membrane protein